MIISGIIVVLALALLLIVGLKWKTIWGFLKTADKSDKYNVIVFVGVSAASLVLLILSVFDTIDEKIVRALILLTITSVTIAILMDRVGVLNDIQSKIGRTEGFRTRTEIENEYPLYAMWEDSTGIRVVTMGGTAFFLGKLKDNLDETLSRSVPFTFVNIKQGTPTWDEHYKNKMENKTTENEIACMGVPETVTEHYADKIDYYQTDINIPYALMQVDKKKRNESFIKVDLYAIKVEDGKRPSILIYPDDQQYEFFKNQIDVIISNSEKIEPKKTAGSTKVMP